MMVKEIKLEEIMTRPVVAARAHATARDVALQLMGGLYSGLPVTDEEGKVVGIVTELDILKALYEGKELFRLTAGDLMSRDPVTVKQETPLEDVVRIMQEKNFIRLPVVDADEKLIGIVARCDIMKAHIEPEFVTYM